MERKNKLLDGINVAMASGAEIGALANPLVKKADGRIFYVDYADSAFLKNRYKDDPNVHIDAIVEVDGIWGNKTIVECLGDAAPVDYIVASHVIEHVPDLVTWLRELRSALAPGGRLCLAIPDKRYSFDFHRNETVIGQVLKAHYYRARTPSVEQVFDHVLSVVPVDTAQLWNFAVPPLPMNTVAGFADLTGLADDIVKNGSYHDVHCWIFTPKSISRLFLQLAAMGLCDFECEKFFDTEFNQLEFFVTLRASDDKEKMMDSWRAVHAQARG